MKEPEGTLTIWRTHIKEIPFSKGSSRDAPEMGIKTYKHQEHQEPSHQKVASV